MFATIDAIHKFLCNSHDFKPLQGTVMGGGGTGKSFLINTIVSFIQTYTQCNDSITVAGPSGGAAFNVGGETTHSLLEVAVHHL